MPNGKNLCHFIGRFTADPEMKYTPAGIALVSFSLAVELPFMKKDGSNDAEVSFLDFVAWRENAERISEYCNKGDRVSLVTFAQKRSWDRDDGTKQYRVEFTVDSVTFLGKAQGSGGGAAPAASKGRAVKTAPEPEDEFSDPFADE